MLRIFLFALAFVLTGGIASATDFTWQYRGTGATYSSAATACQAGMKDANISGIPVTFDHVKFVAENYLECVGLYDGNYDGTANDEISWGYSIRNGDSCPTGSTYDAATGSCSSSRVDGESCNETINGVEAIWDSQSNGGECVPWADSRPELMCPYLSTHTNTPSNYTVAGQLNAQGMPTAPPTFTTDGMSCQMGTLTSEECTVNIKGAISCNVTAVATGKVNTGDGIKDLKDATCSATNPCPTQNATTDKQSDPCVMTNGSCTSTDNTSTTGKLSCGSVNGESVCIASKPTSTGTTVKSTETAATNTDGSVTTTRTDNATTTKCTDVNTCTSSTSTTTTKTTTSSSGVKTSTSSTCTGSCNAATGTASGTTSGSGSNGDGTGDDEDGNTASPSDDCKTPPPCDGDVFLCSILHQEWSDSCAVRALPTDAETAAFQAKIDAVTAQTANAQAELDTQAETLIGQFEAVGTSASGGKCFEDQTYSVHGQSFRVEFSKVCDLLVMFRYALLAVAYIIAARMLSKEF